MTANDEKRKSYEFLQDRMEHWNLWLEGVGFLTVVGFALLCGVYATRGFWSGFWDAIKQFL